MWKSLKDSLKNIGSFFSNLWGSAKALFSRHDAVQEQYERVDYPMWAEYKSHYAESVAPMPGNEISARDLQEIGINSGISDGASLEESIAIEELEDELSNIEFEQEASGMDSMIAYIDSVLEQPGPITGDALYLAGRKCAVTEGLEHFEVPCYQKAYELGHVKAARHLAINHFAGIGTEQNMEKAYECSHFAAMKGDKMAQSFLANMLRTTPNASYLELHLAQYWYGEAAKQYRGEDPRMNVAALNHGEMSDKLRSYEANHPELDVTPREALVEVLLAESNAGYANAQEQLHEELSRDDVFENDADYGSDYGNEHDDSKDSQRATLHDEKDEKIDLHSQVLDVKAEAISGESSAQYEMGEMYADNPDVSYSDLGHAAHWYQQAADNGHPGAQEKHDQAINRQEQFKHMWPDRTREPLNGNRFSNDFDSNDSDASDTSNAPSPSPSP